MRIKQKIWFFLLLVIPLNILASDLPWHFDGQPRYMALGDSITAGKGATPFTHGFVYLLYQQGTYGQANRTQFTNVGVPLAESVHVLNYQVPMAVQLFKPTVITITVGGNDLLKLLSLPDPTDPDAVKKILEEFSINLAQILSILRSQLPPGAQIYIANLYTIPGIPGADIVVPEFNKVLAFVAGQFNVPVVDIHSAFLGRSGLLLIERHGADVTEVHPTNAGHRVISNEFSKSYKQKNIGGSK